MTKQVNAGQARGILQALREDSRRRRALRLLRSLTPLVVSVGILNFALFMAATFYLGGDAWNGKAVGDHYYLWGYHKGTKGYVEVSHQGFDYSRWHVYSVMVTWPLMIVVSLLDRHFGWKSED